MEVSLVEADGLPEGCLLSIRSGSTRRQAAVDSKFKLFFPKGGRAGEEVKVDALLPIGTHVLKLEEGKDQYEMDLNGMQVSLHMKEVEQQPLEQDADAKNEIDAHASHRHRVAISARKYLDEHQLLGWAHRLFQDLIHDQPDDPWAYIDQRTGEARTADLINKAQQKKVEEANLGGLQQAPDLPELPPNLEDDDGVLQTEEEVLDNIRVKAHNALMKAAEDGSLEKALNFDKAQASLEEIRQKAAQHLMKAAQDGSLEKALAGKGMNMDEIDAIRQEAAQTLLKAAEDGSLEAVLSRRTGDQGLDALRQEAAQTLLKAAQDGTLEAVLRKKPADQEVESIRAQAAATLLKAAEDGTLQKVLSSQSVDQDLNLLRQEAAQTLLKAAEDGSLEAVLKKKGTDQQDLDVLRQEAAQTLLKAAQNGTLQAVLSQKTGQDMDKLREDAASLLLKAAEDGTLEAVLSSRVKVQKDQEQLRTKAAGILLRAAEDGTLEDVLMKKAAMKDPEQLRHQAAATLLKAAENGTLEEVLKSKAKGSDLEAIRLEAARALCKAVEVPGTLEAALAKARGQERELEVLKQEAALALLKAAEDGSLDKAFAETRGEDLEGLRKAAAETLLIAAKDGRLEQALGGGATKAQDLEALRLTAADSLLQAAKDGSLEQALEIVKKDFDSVQLDDLRKQAATALLRAAEDGRLASALAPKELEQMRQEAADALLRAAKDGSLEKALLKETRASLTDQEVKDLARNTFEEAALDGRLAKALSQTLASKEVSGEMDVEGLRLAAKDTLLAACADGRLEGALKSRARAEVVDSITTWAAEANQVANPKDIQAIKDKAADALVKALGMEDAAPRVPEPEAKAAPSPPSEEMAKLDVKNVKAKACDALQKALGIDADEPDLEEVKARASWALEKVMTPDGYRPKAPPPEGEEATSTATAMVVSEVKEIARQVREELGRFHGEVSNQLQDLKVLSSEMRRDVEELRSQVNDKKSASAFGTSTVTTIKPDDPLADVAGGSLAELERKIRDRNDRIRRENAAMREENNKLKMMGPKAD